MLSTLGKDAILLSFQNLVQQMSQKKKTSCHFKDKSLIIFEQLISKQAILLCLIKIFFIMVVHRG